MPSTKKRILCVDDDDDTCTMLSVFLSQAGFEVISARTSAEGLRLAKSEQFDAFLLDLWFKDAGKIELFKQIRNFDNETPIIVYSADARQTTREALREANVQAFLTKPEGLDEMIKTLMQLTENKN